MIEELGFFMQQDIESDIGKTKTQVECYSREVTSFLNCCEQGESLSGEFCKQLNQMNNIAQKYNSLKNSTFKNILIRILKRKVDCYLADIITMAEDYTVPLYTVNRYDNIVAIEPEVPLTVNVRADGQIYVDCRYEKDKYEYELVSVELRRIFNSYSLALSYRVWHLQRRDVAFQRVLRNKDILNGVLFSPNFNVLVDHDSKAVRAEMSPLWDEFLTCEEDVKRFLEEAEVNIPVILEKSECQRADNNFYQSVGKKVFEGIKKLS